jgi:hypothetical protein
MTEFKIQLEDSLVQRFGYAEVDNYLKELVKNLYLKISAQDILENINDLDLVNDPQWQIARSSAWEQEKAKYTVTQ